MDARAEYEQKPWLKYYPEGIPAEIDIPEKSLPQVFDEAVEKWRDRTAVIFYGRKITYSELKDHVDRFAAALFDLGVKKGDKVALYLLNCPQFIIAYFAALKVGATLTPISPVYVSGEVKHQIEDSEAKVIVCQDLLYDCVEKAGVGLRTVILTGIGEYLPALKKFMAKTVVRSVYRKMEVPSTKIFEREGFYQFQSLIKKYPPDPPKIQIDPREDLAVLPYTGGTTGLPKGAMLTHYNLVANEAQGQAFWSRVLEEGKEVVIAYLPFYHIYGQVVVMLGGLVRGYTLVLFTTPDVDDILGAIESHRATAFYSVPTLYDVLKDHDKTDRVNWKRFKILVSGADALLEDTAKGFERRTGVEINEGYGLTETSPITHSNPKGRTKIGSFGVPVPSTMAAIVHPEKEEFLPLGEIGEIVIQGPQVMKGYWKNPEETSEKLVDIEGEKWFRTGDLGSMDDEGYFHFYDRKRDLIKYKGYSVFAREIEEVLTSHPKIKEAGVIGVRDPRVGENIKAVIVLEAEARGKLSEEEIISYCKERLAHYKVPRIVEFRGEIPKTDVGKVSRRELREEMG
ncbi:MAG: long-chain fatty acid--CoA ligase [Chloroflexi bacterium]|nr:long-chain fatty acid--CoA ligase [Chloroflexota bacterium]